MRVPLILCVLLVLAPALGQPLRPDEQVDAPPAEAAVRQIEIEAGSQQILDVAGVSRVSIGDDAIAEVRVVEGDQLLLTGLRRGSTDLLVWIESRPEPYRITVTSSRRVKEARSVLDAAGLHGTLELVETSSGKLVLKGTLETVDQLERYQVARPMLPERVDLVRADAAIYDEVAAKITAALHAQDLKGAKATVVAGTIFLEGTVTDEAERKKAGLIARAIHADVVSRLP